MSNTEIPLIITGASGFIGGHLLRKLEGYGAPVLAVDRLDPTDQRLSGIPYHQSELADPATLIPGDFDVSSGFTLIHLAWDMRRGNHYGPQMEQVCLLARLLDYWTDKGLTRLIGMGTAEEYGARSGLLHEYDPPIEPLSPYGLAKRAAGQMAVSWGKRTGRDVMWLRPFIAYGPGQGGDMLLPYAWARARAGQGAEFTDGMQERDFVYVEDVAEGVIRAVACALAGVHVINLGFGVPIQVREVLMEMARLLNAEALFELGARKRRHGEPDRQYADIRAAGDLLGWKPSVDWREGVRRMCDKAPKERSSPLLEQGCEEDNHG